MIFGVGTGSAIASDMTNTNQIKSARTIWTNTPRGSRYASERGSVAIAFMADCVVVSAFEVNEDLSADLDRELFTETFESPKAAVKLFNECRATLAP